MFKCKVFLFGFVFLGTMIFLSCTDDNMDDGSMPFELPSCIPYPDLRGTAEINGVSRWLSLANLSAGESNTEREIVFWLGGYTLECEDYQEILINVFTDLNDEATGTYEVLSGGEERIGFANGNFSTKLIGTFENEKLDLESGTVTINEVGLFKYEISVEATDENNNPFTLEFTNSL